MGISTTTTGKRRDAHPPGGNDILLFKLYVFSEHPPFGRRAVRLLVPRLEVKVLSELWEVSKFITETRFTFFSCTYRISTQNAPWTSLDDYAHMRKSKKTSNTIAQY